MQRFDPLAIESLVREATFQPAPMRPWWVGCCPVVANAVSWIPGVDAVAVYLVGDALVAVAAWRNAQRPSGVARAVAELMELETPLLQAG